MAAAAEVGEFTLLTCSTPAIAEAYLVSFGSDVGRAVDAFFEDQARGSVPVAPAAVPGAHFSQAAPTSPVGRPTTAAHIGSQPAGSGRFASQSPFSRSPRPRSFQDLPDPFAHSVRGSASAPKREREVIAISDSSDDDAAAAPRPSAVPARASALAPRPADRRGHQAAPPLRQDPQAAPASAQPSQAVLPAPTPRLAPQRESLGLDASTGAPAAAAVLTPRSAPPLPHLSPQADAHTPQQNALAPRTPSSAPKPSPKVVTHAARGPSPARAVASTAIAIPAPRLGEDHMGPTREVPEHVFVAFEEAIEAYRVEAAARHNTTPTMIIPSMTVARMTLALTQINWGTVADVRDLPSFGRARRALAGADVLAIYRRCRHQAFGDCPLGVTEQEREEFAALETIAASMTKLRNATANAAPANLGAVSVPDSPAAVPERVAATHAAASTSDLDQERKSFAASETAPNAAVAAAAASATAAGQSSDSEDGALLVDRSAAQVAPRTPPPRREALSRAVLEDVAAAAQMRADALPSCFTAPGHLGFAGMWYRQRASWIYTAETLLPAEATPSQECVVTAAAVLPCLDAARNLLPPTQAPLPAYDTPAAPRLNAFATAAILYCRCRNVRENCMPTPLMAAWIDRFHAALVATTAAFTAMPRGVSDAPELEECAVQRSPADLPECPCTDGVAFFNLVNSTVCQTTVGGLVTGGESTGIWEHTHSGCTVVTARCRVTQYHSCNNQLRARALEGYQAIVHFQARAAASGKSHEMCHLDLLNRHTRWMTSMFSPAFAEVGNPQSESEQLDLLATPCGAGLPMAAPRVAGLQATLSGHQRETLEWMIHREKHQWYLARIAVTDPSIRTITVSTVTGTSAPTPASEEGISRAFGIVADEMGLGKTITTLALIAARPASAAWLRHDRRHIKATLVVVPVSIGVQWEREAKQFLPNHTFHMIHSTYSRKQTPINEADIVVVTYDTMRSRMRSYSSLAEVVFHRVIFDEVQQGATRHMPRTPLGWYRWALTGTPPMNEATFDTIVQWCTQGSQGATAVTPRRLNMKKHDAGPVLVIPQAGNCPVEYARRIVFPAHFVSEQRRAFVMRHVKSDPAVVASLDLPARRTNVVRVVLPGPERRAYAAVEEQTRRDVRGIRRADGRLGAEHVHRLIGWVDRLRRVATEAELARVQGVFQRQAQFEQRAGQVAQQTSVVPAAEAEAALRRDGFKMPEALLEILRALAGDPPEFDECAVCLDGYQRPVVLRCGHVFCHECVTSLSNARGPQNAAQAGRCPLCKELTLDGKKAEIATPSAADAAAPPAAASDAAAAAAEDEAGTPGGKVGAAVRLIASLLEEQGSAKVLVFSVYPQFLTQVHEQLSRRRVRCFEVNGGTTMKKRGELIKAFQDPRDGSRVCLLSSRAGDAGLTLTAANHVVLLEPSLNAAVDAQAIGRVHRFGQRRQVTVHRVVVKGTVEERVQALLDQGRLVTTERTIGSAAQAHYTAEAAGQLADIIAQDAL